MKLTWKRRPFKEAGPGDVLNDRWWVSGYARYWDVKDHSTDPAKRYPERRDCFFASMKEARKFAEGLAQESQTEATR